MASVKSKVKKTLKPRSKQPVNLHIPKEKFNEVMELLNDDDDGEVEAYFKPRCSVQISNITSINRNSFKSTQPKLLEEARMCLMQRDWKNLIKILTMTKLCRKDHVFFFQLLVRYGVCFLAHNPDENLMDLFMLGIAGCCNETEKEQFLKSLGNH